VINNRLYRSYQPDFTLASALRGFNYRSSEFVYAIFINVMQTKPTVTILLITLASLGGWGIWKIADSNGLLARLEKSSITSEKVIAPPLKPTPNAEAKATLDKQDDVYSNLLANIIQHLKQDKVELAIDRVNDHYSSLSTEQLYTFKQRFIRQGLVYSDNGQHTQAQRLYTQLSSLFNDADVLDLLSNASVQLSDWPTALDALLESSLLESNPETLIKKQSALASIASQLKKQFQENNDASNLKALYQKLYEAHPSYAYFQFELALASLSLGDDAIAKTHLSAIQYDLNVGTAATTLLEELRQKQLLEKQHQEQERLAQQEKANPSPDILVSLSRAGNSFLVDSQINGRQARLLLDTGASITALSNDIINQLNLAATGNVIRLSTANGVKESRLFLVKKIQIGNQVIVRNLVVAEINLGNSSQFQGLLGTDLLNKVNGNYLIDNQNNKLIFRR